MEKDKVESRTELPIKRFLRPEQRVKWEKWLNDAGWEQSEEYPAADKNQRVILMLLAELISAEEELTKALATRPSVPQQGQAQFVVDEEEAKGTWRRVGVFLEGENFTLRSHSNRVRIALAASRSEEATPPSWDDAKKMADVMKVEVGELTSEICESVESLFADNGAYDQIKSILSKSLAKHYDYEFKLIHSIPSMMQKAERDAGAPAAGSTERE